MISQIDSNQQKKKPLGEYLIEAGLIAPGQLEMALDRQKVNGRRLGEIVADMGWVQQQTVEYLMAKVVLLEPEALKQKPSDADTYESKNLALVWQDLQAESQDDSLLLLPVATREVKVYLYPKKILRFLLFIITGFVLASLFGQFTKLFLPDYPLRNAFAEMFNVDGDYSIPSLFYSYEFLFSSILLAIIAHTKKVAREKYVRYWQALSIIFFYLSLDKVLTIHQKISQALESRFHPHGFLTYAWVVPGAIFVIIVFLGFLRFLTALPTKTRRLILVAGTIYIGAALGLEMVGGYIQDVYGSANIAYIMEANIEEFLEMLGLVIFIYALLSYINSYTKSLSLNTSRLSFSTCKASKEKCSPMP